MYVAIEHCRSLGADSAHFDITALPPTMRAENDKGGCVAPTAASIVEAALLSNYRFDLHLSEDSRKEHAPLSTIALVTSGAGR
jgi:hypothetical protein